MEKDRWMEHEGGLKYDGYSSVYFYVATCDKGRFHVLTSEGLFLGSNKHGSYRSLKAAIKKAEKLDLVQRKKDDKRREAKCEMNKLLEEQKENK